MFFPARPAALTSSSLLLVRLFGLLLLTSQLVHEAQDRDDDVQGGMRAIATIGGRRIALRAAAGVLLVTPPAGFWLADAVAHRLAVTTLLALFSAVWAFVLVLRPESEGTKTTKRLRLAFRYTSLALGAAILALIST